MPNSISPVLAPYLQSCFKNGSTTLITSVLNTPANWLVLAFIKAAILGLESDLNVANASNHNGTHVVFLSILRPYDFWVELGKKIGLDFSVIISRRQLVYVDGLTVGHNVPQSPAKIIKPKTNSLSDIIHAIDIARTALSSENIEHQQALLFIDGLDFILASQTGTSAVHFTDFFANMHEKFSNLALTLSADSPLLHNVEASATSLEMEHSIFVRSIAYQSDWVMQLRPLETGHAADVSGVIQISRGGGDKDDSQELPEGEWLYQHKGDGSVKVWSRGET